MQVREALMMTASRAFTPDNNYGWGVIDVMAAINYDFCQEPGAPNAPFTSSANPCSGESYDVAWVPEPGATAYELYENDILLYDGPLTQQAVSHASGDYSYSVIAKNGCGSGPESPVGGSVSINHCPCHGNLNCDASIDLLDVVLVIGEAFRNAPPVSDPSCTHASRADVDCDCNVTIGDVVHVVNVAFRNADPATEYCNPCASPCP
jgi:hypothetical protein